MSDDSPAVMSSIKPGDQILKINSQVLLSCNLDEVAKFLIDLQNQGYGQGNGKRFFFLLFGTKREELRVYSWLAVCINPEKVGESPAYCRSLVHTPG